MKLKIIAFCIQVSVFLMISTTAFSQQVLVKGTVKDTISTRFRTSYNQIRIILNDTLTRGYPRYSTPKNKRKPVKRTLAERIARHRKDSIDMEQWHALHNDKRFVQSPDKSGKFQISAFLSDSLIFQSNNFITQRHAVKDLMKLKTIDIQLEPKACEPIFRCNEKNPKLYVVIAEKIEAKYGNEYICPENGAYPISMDSKYEAKYKVLKNISGGYSKDTISFTAFDHYGKPPFLAHKYVMLFISEHCGRLFHEKYQYFDVYPTADGRWARPGDPYRFDKQIPKIFKARKIKFKDDLSFDISNEYEHVIKEEYPKPYFKITRNKAYPLTGVYSEVLFEIKKEGVLKARGFDIQAKQ